MVWCTRAFLLSIYVKLTAIWIELRTPVCHIFPCTVCRVEYILSERVVRAVRAVRLAPALYVLHFHIFRNIPSRARGSRSSAGAALGYKQEAGGEQGRINLPTK